MFRPTSGFLYFTLKACQLEKRAAVGKHLHSIIQSSFYHCKLPLIQTLTSTIMSQQRGRGRPTAINLSDRVRICVLTTLSLSLTLQNNNSIRVFRWWAASLIVPQILVKLQHCLIVSVCFSLHKHMHRVSWSLSPLLSSILRHAFHYYNETSYND